MVKITYLFHSGFKIETEKKIIVFDYFKDNCIKQKNKCCGQLCDNIGEDKELYFFVSHAHYDHYDKEIFKFRNTRKYIISSDIKVCTDDKIIRCKPGEEFEIDDIFVKVFGSTDEGVSYLINIEGVNIFHAGDLNWWHWDGETDEEKESAEKMFLKEIGKLSKEKIDIAIFPVDPRLDRAYCLGGKKFIEEIKPEIFIPMHFLDCYDVTKDFALLMKDCKYCKIYTISHRGEELIDYEKKS